MYAIKKRCQKSPPTCYTFHSSLRFFSDLPPSCSSLVQHHYFSAVPGDLKGHRSPKKPVAKNQGNSDGKRNWKLVG